MIGELFCSAKDLDECVRGWMNALHILDLLSSHGQVATSVGSGAMPLRPRAGAGAAAREPRLTLAHGGGRSQVCLKTNVISLRPVAS